MYSTRRMKKNILPNQMKKEFKKQKMIALSILFLGFLFIFFIFYINSIQTNQSIIEYILTHQILTFVEFTICIGIGGGLYLIVKTGYLISPKYIKWDKDHIEIINRKNEKEKINWKEIKKISKISKMSSLNKEFPGYSLYIKGKLSPRQLNEEIGRELKEYYRKRKWKINNS